MFAKKFMLSAAAATLFLSGAVMAQETTPASEAKVHCGGVNSCKGTSDCKTAANACKGQNACKGIGYKELTVEDCEKAGGEVLEG